MLFKIIQLGASGQIWTTFRKVFLAISNNELYFIKKNQGIVYQHHRKKE